jgi:GntR family transcriptional regulator, transcriptional repressor for pyruvate dehydrogenase complex
MPSDGSAQRLSDQIYERLLAMLGEEGYAPDVRLPSEQALARRFAVSRPVLRQALFQLRTGGHIYSRKGSGSFVRAPVAPSPAITFGPLNSIPDVRSFQEFRCSLEGETAALAAARHVAEEIAEIERRQMAIATARAGSQSAIEEDLGFHAEIARASGNRFFVETLAALREQMRFGIRLVRDLSDRPIADRHAEVSREHAAISAAIAGGDPDRARRAMTAHLQGGIRRLFGH